jgi:hypothetical protein
VYLFNLSFFISSYNSRLFSYQFFSLCVHVLFYLSSLIVLCSSCFSFFHSFSLFYFVYINPCEEENVIRNSNKTLSVAIDIFAFFSVI